MRAEGLIIKGEREAVKVRADEINVFLLPSRVGYCGENGDAFGKLRVKGDGFTFFFFFELGSFGGCYARAGMADIFASCSEVGLGEGNLRPQGELDGCRLWSERQS